MAENFRNFLLLLCLLPKPSFASTLKHILHLPDSRKNIPLVVMLHGCDQTASDFADVTGMSELGKKFDFAVLYPEQDRLRNEYGCWNWFNKPGPDLSSNEANLIVDLVAKIKRGNTQISGSIFIAGLSAGGAMAGYLGTCFPDIFKAVAIHSSVSYRRVRGPSEAMAAMKNGPNDLLKETPTCKGFKHAPLLVIQGEQDKIVKSRNASALMDDLGTADAKSAILLVPKLNHSWAGGKAGLKYSEPESISASAFIWEFFRK